MIAKISDLAKGHVINAIVRDDAGTPMVVYHGGQVIETDSYAAVARVKFPGVVEYKKVRYEDIGMVYSERRVLSIMSYAQMNDIVRGKGKLSSAKSGLRWP